MEIDETLIARRKYNRGRWVPQRWVFGGIDTDSKIGFLRYVPDRKAETLYPIIKEMIKPGTTIHSDSWKAYHKINEIDVTPPYMHKMVNHSKHYVDPVSKAHTNTVENMWRMCKSKLFSMYGAPSSTLPSHLDEFMWRQQYGKTEKECFAHILQHISLLYKVN